MDNNGRIPLSFFKNKRKFDSSYPSFFEVNVTNRAFFSMASLISDPGVGGTFMTFLMTLNNIGSKCQGSFSLWLVDMITFKVCTQTPANSLAPTLLQNNTKLFNQNFEENTCYGPTEIKECENGGGKCSTMTEGFYYLCVASFIIGPVWLIWGWRTIQRLQQKEVSEWRVVKKGREVSEEVNEEGKKFNYFYCF